jgi:hypothetical protein
MCFVPIRYLIWLWYRNWNAGCCLNSWVIKTLMNGRTCYEIDRQQGNLSQKGGSIGSFTISRESKCRFIWICQNVKTEKGNKYFAIFFSEIFVYLINSFAKWTFNDLNCSRIVFAAKFTHISRAFLNTILSSLNFILLNLIDASNPWIKTWREHASR